MRLDVQLCMNQAYPFTLWPLLYMSSLHGRPGDFWASIGIKLSTGLRLNKNILICVYVTFTWKNRQNVLHNISIHAGSTGPVPIARREPQRGPGNHYRAALSQPIGVRKGGRGSQWELLGMSPPPPKKKKIGKIFFGQLSCKFWEFSGKYHVHFLNFRANITNIRLRVWDP